MFQRWKGNKGMKYKLLKDTPTIKAGTIFEEIVNMSDGTRELTVAVPGEDTPQDPQFTIQDIDNFDEWFEEIQEPTDSIHWKPVIGEEYWSFYSDGGISHNVCTGGYWDTARYEMGRTYRTEEECEKARDRELAKVRLSQTSDFEPDFENGSGGWVVCYRRRAGKLDYIKTYGCDSGEPVRYATMKEAERSIRENREDWLIYFGVKE